LDREENSTSTPKTKIEDFLRHFLHRFEKKKKKKKKKLHREHGTEEKCVHAFQREIERNSQYLVDQLLQKIGKLEDENNRKIIEVEEKCKSEIEKLSENYYREIQNLE
ncbi:Uncharacterized protein FWK35_00034138, partial [Aphis craccivora]